MQLIQPNNHLEAFNPLTTIVLITGFFRINEYFKYNVRNDDFVKIISKYINEKTIEIAKNATIKNLNDRVIDIDSLNKQFFVVVCLSTKQMLRK